MKLRDMLESVSENDITSQEFGEKYEKIKSTFKKYLSLLKVKSTTDASASKGLDF